MVLMLWLVVVVLVGVLDWWTCSGAGLLLCCGLLLGWCCCDVLDCCCCDVVGLVWFVCVRVRAWVGGGVVCACRWAGWLVVGVVYHAGRQAVFDLGWGYCYWWG